MLFDINIADFTHCDTFLADHTLDNDEQLHFDDRISISTRCRCSCSCLKDCTVILGMRFHAECVMPELC